MPFIKFPTSLPSPKLPSPEPCHRPGQRTFPLPWFRECTPKILVVTDGLNFDNTSDFLKVLNSQTCKQKLVNRTKNLRHRLLSNYNYNSFTKDIRT